MGCPPLKKIIMIQKLFKYSFRVWITSVLVAPAIYIIASALLRYSTITFSPNSSDNVFEVYLLFVFCGALFSVATWLVFYLVIWLIANVCPAELRKIFIFLFGVALTPATFIVVFGVHTAFNPHEDLSILMYANTLCIGAGVWFYDLKIIDENTGYFETNAGSF